jgi:hypothetical protein
VDTQQHLLELDPSAGRARASTWRLREKWPSWLTKKNADAQRHGETRMQEIAQLLVILVAYYATFGIMAIGFGMMLGGTDSASAAGNFFVRPVRRPCGYARRLQQSGAIIGSSGWVATSRSAIRYPVLVTKRGFRRVIQPRVSGVSSVWGEVIQRPHCLIGDDVKFIIKALATSSSLLR